MVLDNGIPGTAMPSFRLLSKEDKEALIDYVVYLSIRGTFERDVTGILVELGEEDSLLDFGDATSAAGSSASEGSETGSTGSNSDEEAKEKLLASLDEPIGIVMDAVESWHSGNQAGVEVPLPPPGFKSNENGHKEVVKLGQQLFVTTGNCHSCHGYTALGDGQIDKYDAVTEEWYSEIQYDTGDKLKKFLELGALPPRKIRPRNLQLGVYRGGNRPVDLYLRIKNGIDGTPMPAAPANMTSDEVWSIVAYVQSLTMRQQTETPLPVNERVVR
jgi:mono/diheme cytochrome c family protein